ncbi:MAG: hypothetical protein SNJ70_04050, partial [Armatimonadota bacterium]
AFIEKTNMGRPNNPNLANKGLAPAWRDSRNAPIDRLWVLWRKSGSGVAASSIYYKTYRIGIDLSLLDQPAINMNNDGSPASLTVSGNLGAWFVDRTGNKIYLTEADEHYRSLITSGSNIVTRDPGQISIEYEYTDSQGNKKTNRLDNLDTFWIEEIPEQALLTATADTVVNEGSIYAFADPVDVINGTLQPSVSSKIWVFWTSTRAGTTDLFWQTVSPGVSVQ